MDQIRSYEEVELVRGVSVIVGIEDLQRHGLSESDLYDWKIWSLTPSWQIKALKPNSYSGWP